MICDSYNEAEQDMASLKDLDIISERSDKRVAEALNRQIIWIVGVAFAVIGAMVALKLFN